MIELNPLVYLNSLVGRVQRRYPRLRKLDDAQWKTWTLHSAVAIAIGTLLGLLPWVTASAGIRLVVLFYLEREVRQARRHRRVTLDNVLDALAPFVAGEIWIRTIGRIIGV